MAPSVRQRTFEIIPNAPVLGQQNPGDNAQPIYSRPPMTTKQAKKLHNQKNKGPKLSKAEQRRIELMEQDRIRKEFEKEKAQARARTAREKKKAKEDKEKEERKRKGLPLVDIHPSQDTISRFINRVGRAIGVKQDSTAIRTLDSVREDSEPVTNACEYTNDTGHEEDDESDKENQDTVKDPGPERPAKRRRLSQPDETVGTTSPVASQLRAGPVAKIARQLEVESYSRASSVDTDDPINETLLEEQIIADVELASSRKTRSSNDEFPEFTLAEKPRDSVPQPLSATVPVTPGPKEHSVPCPSPSRIPPPQQSTILIGEELHPRAQAATHAPSHAPSHLGLEVFKKPTSPYISAPRPRAINASSAFKKPMVPSKIKNPLAIGLILTAERPRFLPKHVNAAHQRQGPPARQLPELAFPYAIPTSTQAFLLDHVDDLFPSPTQEARELSGPSVTEPQKPSVDPPRPSINGPMFQSEAVITQHAVVAAHTAPTSKLLAPVAEDFFESSFISTQDFMFSTQDIFEMDTPSKARQTPAAPSIPTTNDGLLTSVPGADDVERKGFNLGAALNTAKGCVESPLNEVDKHRTSAKPVGAAKCCTSGQFSGPSQYQGHRSSCRTGQHLSSPQVTQRGQMDRATVAARPLRSSYQQHITVTQQRRASTPENKSSTTATSLGGITTPERPPSKKRMFGSSGPGPEGLIAMERSYQEMRRQERALEAQIREQKKLLKPAGLQSQQLDLDIAQFADDLLDDDLCESTQKSSSRRPSGAVQQDSSIHQSPSSDKRTKTIIASQETDYGDIDGDDLDFLQGDTSWLNADLDDI